MIGEYSCPFLRNTGKACGNASTRPEGCRFHWKAKNVYLVLIAESLQPLLVDDVHYMLEVIMLPDTMIDFDKKELMLANSMLANFMIDLDQRYEKKVMRK